MWNANTDFIAIVPLVRATRDTDVDDNDEPPQNACAP